MKKLALVTIALMVAIAFFALIVSAQEGTTKEEGTKEEAKAEQKFEYVGATKCKICHKLQYESWAETPHAKAYAALSAEEQKKDECVGCHITGTTAKGELLENVQCEACHGPGSEYKSVKIMSPSKWKEDPDKQLQMAIDAGLILPTEEVCMKCHKKEGNPNFKPFDFAKMKPKVHAFNEEESSEKSE
jgi:cytochrome c553